MGLDLEKVVLVPTGRAPHKVIEPEPGPEVRMEMAELAARDDERLSVSGVEVDREGTSYTSDTLELLARENPQDEHTVILGADQAADLGHWRRPERILELARIGVARRHGVAEEEVDGTLASLDSGARASWFSMPAIDVSSSMIRARVASSVPIRYLVPDPVAELIAARGLYR